LHDYELDVNIVIYNYILWPSVHVYPVAVTDMVCGPHFCGHHCI